MDLNSLPMPITEKSKTKQIIINILSLKERLTSKELFNIINREFSKNVSYQAVHRKLKELCEEKVILKEGDRSYLINPEWVEEITNYINNFSKEPLITRSFKMELQEKGVAFLHFEKLMEMGRFCITEIMGLPPKGKDTVCFWYHMWPPIGLSDREMEKLKNNFANGNYLILSQFDTPMDVICKNFFEAIGAKVFLGIPVSFEMDLIVHGDYIVYLHFDSRKRKDWDNLCKLNRKFEKINLINFLKPLSLLKSPVDIVMVKHPELAEKIRKHAKECAKKNGKTTGFFG